MDRFRALAIGWPWLLGCIVAMVPATAAAQAATDEAVADNVFVWAERSTLQKLADARELIAAQRFAEAVRYLGAILDAPEDYFIQPDAKDPVYRSLKGEAHRLIGEMPPRGRESYELQFGARARQLLGEAIAAGDTGGLAEVSRRFFHTASGYQATLLLGMGELRAGRRLSAAMTLDRLRQLCPDPRQFEPALSLSLAACWLDAGNVERTAAVLAELKRARGGRPVVVAGSEIALFAEGEDSAAWLRKLVGSTTDRRTSPNDAWLMFRGDSARNMTTPASAPLLNMRWRVPITDDPVVETYLQQRRQAYQDQGASEAPGLHPLAVGDVVLMRTVQNLLAVDFSTGKRLWQVPVDTPLDSLVDGSASESLMEQSPLAVGLEQRVWDDATYGTLSSDGRLVFSIEDLGLGIGMPFQRQVIVNGRRQADPAEPKPFNRLTAHDIRTGKLKWHLGGKAGQYALRLSETFFLGPPLPLAGRLYVLAEVHEEIRLLALDAETGDLLWSQQLAIAEQTVTRDAVRRLAGVSPSYADGILVCPTAAGAVIGVELSTRSLLWGYRYPRTRDAAQSPNPVAMRWGLLRGAEPIDRWGDASATLVDRRVIVGPVEANEVHCLNLVDGTLLWKAPRQDDLYLACVDDGKVVLAGKRSLRALRLADGKPAWDGRSVSLPDAATPSGRGFLAEATYYLPLSTAEVVAVDLAAGKLARTSKSREGTIPGNLISYRGRVISQSVDAVESYFQLDTLCRHIDERLRQSAADPEALALRGEILADEGKRDEAIAAYRQARRLSTDPRTADLLRDALLDALRFDFARYRDDAAEIERLADDPAHLSAFLRLMVAGHQRCGQWQPALDYLRRLVELDRRQPGDEQVSRSLAVRRHRWIRSQFAAMSRGDDARPALDRLVGEAWKAAAAEGTVEAYQSFLSYFADQPAAAEARAALLKSLAADERFLEAEIALWPQLTSDQQPEAAAATAALAELLRRAQRPEDAAVFYNRLQDRFGDVVVDGRTGRTIVEELPGDDPVRTAMVGPAPWPVGKVEAARLRPERLRPPSYGRVPMTFRQGQTPFFADRTFQMDQNARTMIIRDGLGRTVQQVSFAEGEQRNQTIHFGSNSLWGRGHLLVLASDQRLVGLDMLAKGRPARVFQKDLSDAEPPTREVRGRLFIPNMPFPGMRIQSRFGVPASSVGLVAGEVIVYQRRRECIAISPARGEPLWVRRDVPPGSTIFGDEQRIFIVSPEKPESQEHYDALVISALDGSYLGLRRTPPPDQCLGMLGGQVIVWKMHGEGHLLERVDPWQRRALWSGHRFDANARASMIGEDAVAVVETSGRFTIVDLESGKAVVQAPIAPEQSLADFVALQWEDQYLLVTNRAANHQGLSVSTQPMPGVSYKQIVAGLVYAFGRDGKAAWPNPVKVENQYLLTDQPAALPVLLFACQPYARRGNGPGMYSTAVMAIDKRTGRTVLNETVPNSTAFFEIVGNRENHTVDVRLQQATLRMVFTDEPLPPPSAGPEPLAQPAGRSKLLDALFESMRAAAEQVVRPAK